MIAAIITLGVLSVALIALLLYVFRLLFKLLDDLKDQVIAKDPLELLAIKRAKEPVSAIPEEPVDSDGIPLTEGNADVVREAIKKITKGRK